jgi:hypothetical protein
MRSEKQRQASRENGAKSKGPVTAEGKGKSSMNRLRHGLRSNQVVLPGENAEEFNAELKGWRDDWRPRGHTAAVLVERAAVASWRLRRCVRAESDLLMTMAIRAARKKRRGVASTDDPESRAERAEGRLYRKPAEAVAELRSFLEGVDRLVARWGELDDVLAEDAQEWHEGDYHDTLMNLLGLDSEVDAAEAGPMAEDSRRLIASNNAQLLVDRLPSDEADAIGARLRAGIAREVEALEALARELAEPDDDGEPVRDDGAPDEEIKFLGVTRQTMLLHRYEMAIERSMRGAMKDLMALEKARPGLGRPAECKTELAAVKQVRTTISAVSAGPVPGPSPAPNEPEPAADPAASGEPRRRRGGRSRRPRRPEARRSTS